MRTIGLAVVLTACWHSTSSPPPAPPPAPTTRPNLAADCKRALDEKPSPTLTPEEREGFDALAAARIALERVCIEDQWPVAVTDCFAASTPEQPAGRCFDLGLTEAQIAHLRRAYAAAKPP